MYLKNPIFPLPVIDLSEPSQDTGPDGISFGTPEFSQEDILSLFNMQKVQIYMNLQLHMYIVQKGINGLEGDVASIYEESIASSL